MLRCRRSNSIRKPHSPLCSVDAESPSAPMHRWRCSQGTDVAVQMDLPIGSDDAVSFIPSPVVVVYLIPSPVVVVYLIPSPVVVVYLIPSSVVVVYLIPSPVAVVYLIPSPVVVVYLIPSPVAVVYLIPSSVGVVNSSAYEFFSSVVMQPPLYLHLKFVFGRIHRWTTTAYMIECSL